VLEAVLFALDVLVVVVLLVFDAGGGVVALLAVLEVFVVVVVVVVVLLALAGAVDVQAAEISSAAVKTPSNNRFFIYCSRFPRMVNG
jgi:hypothetical protein